MLNLAWPRKRLAPLEAPTPITQPGYRRGQRPPNYGKRYPAEILSREEIDRLLGACSRRGYAGLRMRALIVVMWRAGLRVGEALALQAKDVDLDEGTIAVLHGKGDRARVVGIDHQALAVIEAWMRARRELGIGPMRPLFCTISGERRGQRVGDPYVRDALKELARKAGIEHRVHPHGLRHTHAAELAREGVPVHVIRKQLGHFSLDTTARYIEHLEPREVIEAMRSRSWSSHVQLPIEPYELEHVSGTA
jgi:integrase/recombinase XerD